MPPVGRPRTRSLPPCVPLVGEGQGGGARAKHCRLFFREGKSERSARPPPQPAPTRGAGATRRLPAIGPPLIRSAASNAFEMVERFAAGAAAPQRLARGRAEFRYALGVLRAAAGAGDVGRSLEQGALGCAAFRRRNPVGRKLLARRFAHAIRR